MKKLHIAGLAALALMLPVRPAVSDEPFRMIWRGTGGWGDNSAYCKLYDPNNVETVRGIVAYIDYVTPLPGMREGIEIHLKTDTETIPVQLGPRWYLENQDFDLEPQDHIVVKGSRFACEGHRVMAAAEILKNGQTLKLRDDKGHPLWTAATPHP